MKESFWQIGEKALFGNTHEDHPSSQEYTLPSQSQIKKQKGSPQLGKSPTFTPLFASSPIRSDYQTKSPEQDS